MGKLRGMWRSKTVYFGLLVAVLGYAQAARGDVDLLLTTLGLEWLKPFIWPAVGVGIVYLRWLTTQPLDEK